MSRAAYFRQYRQDHAARLKDQRAARAAARAKPPEWTEPLVRRSLALPLSLDLLLRLAADQEGRPQVAVIRDALARYIAVSRPSGSSPPAPLAPPPDRPI